MGTDELNCKRCGEALSLSGLIDGREINAGIHLLPGRVQSAEFELECQCCGHVNTLEFDFAEDDPVYPY